MQMWFPGVFASWPVHECLQLGWRLYSMVEWRWKKLTHTCWKCQGGNSSPVLLAAFSVLRTWFQFSVWTLETLLSIGQETGKAHTHTHKIIICPSPIAPYTWQWQLMKLPVCHWLIVEELLHSVSFSHFLCSTYIHTYVYVYVSIDTVFICQITYQASVEILHISTHGLITGWV